MWCSQPTCTWISCPNWRDRVTRVRRLMLGRTSATKMLWNADWFEHFSEGPLSGLTCIRSNKLNHKTRSFSVFRVCKMVKENSRLEITSWRHIKADSCRLISTNVDSYRLFYKSLLCSRTKSIKRARIIFTWVQSVDYTATASPGWPHYKQPTPEPRWSSQSEPIFSPRRLPHSKICRMFANIDWRLPAMRLWPPVNHIPSIRLMESGKNRS